MSTTMTPTPFPSPFCRLQHRTSIRIRCIRRFGSRRLRFIFPFPQLFAGRTAGFIAFCLRRRARDCHISTPRCRRRPPRRAVWPTISCSLFCRETIPTFLDTINTATNRRGALCRNLCLDIGIGSGRNRRGGRSEDADLFFDGRASGMWQLLWQSDLIYNFIRRMTSFCFYFVR